MTSNRTDFMDRNFPHTFHLHNNIERFPVGAALEFAMVDAGWERMYSADRADVVFFYGQKGEEGLEIERLRAYSPTTCPVVIEYGWFFRGARGQYSEEGCFQICAGGLNNPIEIDRIFEREKYEVAFEAWRRVGLPIVDGVDMRGQSALLLGQVPEDSQHNLSQYDLEQWLNQKCNFLQKVGYKEILFRPHPSAPHLTVAGAEKLDYCEKLETHLAYVDTAVCYNSTSGIEAIRLGKRVICDHSAFYYPYAEGQRDKNELFARLAVSQWQVSELFEGADWVAPIWIMLAVKDWMAKLGLAKRGKLW